MISNRFYSNVNTYIIFHLFQFQPVLFLLTWYYWNTVASGTYYSCNEQNYLLMVILILVMEINTFIKIMVNKTIRLY